MGRLLGRTGPGRLSSDRTHGAGGGEPSGFTADITRRARWARDHNGGRPEPARPAGERLAVALVHGDQATLDAEGYTRQQAAQRLAADPACYGYPADTGAWLTQIRAALGDPGGRRAEPTPDRPGLPYTHCPSCGLAAQPGSMNYRLAAGGGIDWTGTVHASCGICGRHHVVTSVHVLPLDAGHSCPRPECGTVTPCPATAARVRCHRCGVYGIGPGAATDAGPRRAGTPEAAARLRATPSVLRTRRGER